MGQNTIFPNVVTPHPVYLVTIHLSERLAKKLMIAKPLIVSTIKNETAFSTGVELNRIREYKSAGKVGSEPNSVNSKKT